MALINCPECGKQISDSSERCINCGFPITKMVKQIEENESKIVPANTKKRFFTLVIAVVLIAITVASGFYWYLYSQDTKSGIENDLAKMNLKGNIKTLSEKTTNKDGQSKDYGQLIAGAFYVFNNYGNLTQKTDYDYSYRYLFKGADTIISNYQYNNKEQLVKLTITGFEGTGGAHQQCFYNYIETHLYEYDSNEKVIKENCTVEIKYIDSLSFVYEEMFSDHKTVDIQGNVSNMEGETNIYKYDDNKDLIEQSNFMHDGRCVSKYIYKYNDKHLQIVKESFEINESKNFSLTKTETFTYDDHGRVIEIADVNSKTFIRTKYDDMGNKIEGYEKFIGYNGLFSFESFDKVDNWLSRITYRKTGFGETEKKEPIMITKREIVYY